MKTNVLLYSAILMMAMAAKPAHATGGETEKSKSVFSIETQMAQQIHLPMEALQTMGSKEATVHFSVNNDFSVNLLQLECGDAFLARHVRRAIARQRIYMDKQDIGKKYSVKLRFQ